MEIGNQKKLLYAVLKQAIADKSNDTKKDPDQQSPVDRMEFGNELKMIVTEGFDVTVPTPYVIGGKSGVSLSVRPRSFVDNNSDTIDNIFVQTPSGDSYQVIEQIPSDRWHYLVQKWDTESGTWQLSREGLVL